MIPARLSRSFGVLDFSCRKNDNYIMLHCMRSTGQKPHSSDKTYFYTVEVDVDTLTETCGSVHFVDCLIYLHAYY